MSNVEKLQAAGLIPTPHTLSPEDQDAVESLTDDEVHSLISIKKKLGDDFVRRNASGDANCIV